MKRVLSRVLAFDGDLAQAAPQRQLWDCATRLLPPPELREGAAPSAIASYTQGLMDLGAGLCSLRAPACLLCPVRDRCRGSASGQPQRYPVKTRKTRRSSRTTQWLVPVWRDRLWLMQRPPTGIWPGLWSPCEFVDAASLQQATATWPGAGSEMQAFVHVLTHLDWTLEPRLHRLPDALDHDELDALTALLPQTGQGRWFERSELGRIGVPAALTRLLGQLG